MIKYDSSGRIELWGDNELKSVRTRFGNPIPHHEDWGGKVWAFTDTYLSPVTMVVVAQSYYDAYETVLDNLEPIADDEVPLAHGFDGEQAKERFEKALRGEEWPDLEDGYAYQPNATGSGIVHLGYDYYLRPLTKRIIEDNGLVVEIGEVEL